jgi:hypothetical protein
MAVTVWLPGEGAQAFCSVFLHPRRRWAMAALIIIRASVP